MPHFTENTNAETIVQTMLRINQNLTQKVYLNHITIFNGLSNDITKETEKEQLTLQQTAYETNT